MPSNEHRFRGQITAVGPVAVSGLAEDAVKATSGPLEGTAEVSPPFHLRRDLLTAAILAFVAFAAFVPALSCGFINLDDNTYVLENEHVLQGLSAQDVRWALTTFREANWHPLTWLSLQLDATVWKTPDGGPNPFGFHLTNVLMHAASAALLFLALYALTNAFWRSLAVSLLFAVHPLRVESVAWVAERKDVLSLFFGLAALWFYARYARRSSVGRYLLVVLPFTLSLLCKPMLVTLPCLLLVLDWWPLGRWPASGAWPLIREKLPLFLLVAASSTITFLAQSSAGAVVGVRHIAPALRLENAVVSYETYLAETFWPTRLAIYYHHSAFSGPGLELPAVAVAVLLLVAISAAAFLLRRRAPYLLVGWLWYVGTLVPVIGLVQVGGQAHADRYTYFPQIGVLIAVSWGAARLASDWQRSLGAAVAAAALLLAVLTWRQASLWQDSTTIWRHTLDVARSPRALNHFGATLLDNGKPAEAAPYFEDALGSEPAYADACFNLAVSMEMSGRLSEAAKFFERLCKLKPRSTPGYLRLGDVYRRQGKLSEAAQCYEKALQIPPESSATYCNLGMVEMARKNPARAADCYRAALRLKPDLAEAHNGLGSILVKAGQVDEGIGELREAIRCDSRAGQAYNNLGKALEDRGDLAAAVEQYEEGTRVSPKIAMIWFNLGRIRVKQNRLAEAATCFETSITNDSRTPEFRVALVETLNRSAATRAAAGSFDEAVTAAERAREVAAQAGWADATRQIEERLEHYRHRENGAPAREP
jgi:protein O-mannosyl-transferase